MSFSNLLNGATADSSILIFAPTAILLVGVVAIWFQIVGSTGLADAAQSLQSKSVVGHSDAEIQRHGYYHSERHFNNRHAGANVKHNLLMLLVFVFAAEAFVNSPVLAGVGMTDYGNGMLNHSMLTYLMKLAVLFFALITISFIDEHEIGMSASVIGLIGAIIFFALILVSANHLIVLYVALEGISLLAFVLAAYTKTPASVESGLKYFFTSSFASAILLVGVAITFIGLQELNFHAIQGALINAPVADITALGILLISIAFLFKISAFPGHFGSPDVYKGPLTSIVNIFAVGIKLTAFLGLILIHTNMLVFTSLEINWLFYVSAAASLIIGLIGALRVLAESGDIRSFLAFTSINQVGFILMGLVCSNLEGLLASLVYLCTYLLASALFIGIISRIRCQTGVHDRAFEKFSDFKSVYAGGFSRKTDLLILAFSVWSMAGLPPLAGFVGKLAIGIAMIHRMESFLMGASGTEILTTFQFVELDQLTNPVYAYAALLVLSLLVSLISATYYFKIYELMAPAATSSEASNNKEETTVHVVHDRSSLVAMVTLIVLILVGIGTVSGSYGELPLAFPAKLADIGMVAPPFTE